MKVGSLQRTIGGKSKVGCVLGLDFKHLDGASFMSNGDCYGHLCTNYGSKWQLDGRYFNGVDNYVDVGELPKYSPSTIEAWVNSIKAQKAFAGIVFAGDSTTAWGLAIRGGIVFSRISTGTAQDGWNIEGYNEANYPAGWHQMVITDDGAIRKYYRDGKFVSQRTNTLTNSGTAQEMSIGRWGTYTDSSSYFQGLIDEVRIYNRALSADEIKAHFLGARVPKAW